MRIIVVGAGLSGLMAARECVARGHEVIVFDKGRGVGGRLGVHRVDGPPVNAVAPVETVVRRVHPHRAFPSARCIRDRRAVVDLQINNLQVRHV